MHSLKDYSLKLREQDYHDLPVWSYSIVARYAKEGFSSLATLHERFEQTASMEFGSLFDSIMTRGKQTLDEYYVSDSSSCPPAEKAVFDWLLANGQTEPFVALDNNIVLQAIDACPTFCSKYKKFDTRMEKLAEASSYYDLRRSGKKVVSQQDWDDAIEMYRSIRNNDYLKGIFGTSNTKDVEYIYQAQFKERYTLPSGKEVDIKIMPDLIVVNHKNKTIQPVDLKTSSIPAYEFKDNFLKFRYDIQAHMYSDILEVIIKKDSEYSNYTILPYLFTDISRTDKVPVTYVYDQTDPSQSEGFSFSTGDRTYQYKSWQVLLDEILEYEEQNAVVPSYITTDGPNNLLDILSR